MLRGFAQTDRGIAFAGAGTIGTELKAEQHFASYADVGDINVGWIRREAWLTFTSLITFTASATLIHHGRKYTDQQYFGHNCDKFKYKPRVVIYCNEYNEGNANLLMQQSPPHLINFATLPCKLDNRHVLQSTKS